LDAAGKLVGTFDGTVHRRKVFVHLVEVLVDELVDDLGW